MSDVNGGVRRGVEVRVVWAVFLWMVTFGEVFGCWVIAQHLAMEFDIHPLVDILLAIACTALLIALTGFGAYRASVWADSGFREEPHAGK